MDLIRQLYDLVVKSHANDIVIQLVPPEHAGDGILAIENEGKLEIGLSKPVYLKLFKQSHDNWHHFDLAAWETDEPAWWDAYYMTLGYLITTNENHTIIRLHELVLQKLYQKHGQWVLDNEFEVISTFLSSRLKRINKSSSLWLLMKKLTILLIFNSGPNYVAKYRKLINRVLMSCKFHFANYYANNFFKWLNGIGQILHFEDYAGAKLVSACQENVKDCSLWSTLATWLYTQPNLQNYADQYNQLAQQIELQFPSWEIKRINLHENEANGPQSNQNLALTKKYFEWLIDVKCCTLYPYTVLLDVVLVSGGDIDLYNRELDENLSENRRFLAQIHSKDSLAYSTTTSFVNTLQLARNHTLR